MLLDTKYLEEGLVAAKAKHAQRMAFEAEMFQAEVRDSHLNDVLSSIAKLATRVPFYAEVVPRDEVPEKQFIKGVSLKSDSFVLYHGAGEKWVFTYTAKKSDSAGSGYKRYFSYYHAYIWHRLEPSPNGKPDYSVISDGRFEVQSVQDFVQMLIDQTGFVQALMESRAAEDLTKPEV
ncbi:hypothetical protein [Rhizobium leguminosarum]|uniref:hypothetical protein n=1 Tax=Rhizobium leguminosarum TaxID=384 RepID=UPI003CFE6BBF